MKFNRRELEGLILKRINFFYAQLKDHQVLSPETHEAGELQDGFVEDYDLLNVVKHTFLVPDWEDIGIADPFPSEDNQHDSTFKVPETAE